jgi:hypothetical protein
MPVFNGWRTSWDLLVPTILGGSPSGVVLYDAEAGHAELHGTDVTGDFPLINTYTDWRTTWTQIVSGYWTTGDTQTQFLVFYEQSTGYAEFYSYDDSGNLTFIQSYSDWRQSWEMILPFNLGVNGQKSQSGLLFYQKEPGYAELYFTDHSGNITLMNSYNGWRSSWDLIVPGSYGNLGWTDLLFYDSSAAQIQLYAFDPDGNMEYMNTIDDVAPTDMIVSGIFGGPQAVGPGPYTSDILTYNAVTDTGIAMVFETDGRGNLNQINGFDDWRNSWTVMISLASSNPDSAYSTILLYDKAHGVGQTYLYSTPTPWLIRPIEGYASAPSVTAGDTIDFHLYSNVPEVTVKVFREGISETAVWDGNILVDNNTPTSNGAADCQWPVALSLQIPDDWQSAAYIARASNATSSVDILFVVTPSTPGDSARVLLMVPVTTFQAYNRWGGNSLYGETSNDIVGWTYGWSDDPPCNNQDVPCQRALSVSFHRPYAHLFDFYYLVLPFLQWCERMEIPVDVCTSLDLHVGPDLVLNYGLLMSVGHDEYWSEQMRVNVQVFTGNGGNVAFFSANTCWWQVRFTDQSATMICYKDENLDPLGPQSPLATTNWYRVQNNPLGSENSTTGVSYLNGNGMNFPPSPLLPFVVVNDTNWVIDGTGLSARDEFGVGINYNSSVIGYEEDAALFDSRTMAPTGLDGTPLNATIIAIADLTPWQQAGRYATMLTFQTKSVDGIPGGGGWVFTVGTINWSRGLSTTGNLTAVDQITLSVINDLA